MKKGTSKAFPSYDYLSQDFYNAIEQLAKNGATDSEIAHGLRHSIGIELDIKQFSSLKRGEAPIKYNDEEKKEISNRIYECLERARQDMNRVVKAVYLSTALGKNTTKTVTTVRRRLRIDGELTDNEEIQTTEVVSGIAPNFQALATWLYHHDKNWRTIQRGEDENENDDVPSGDKVKKGVSISDWLDKELTDTSILNKESVDLLGVGDVEDTL